ncbi:MAG: preprotein translocase subunit SecA [Dehalococcoidia bacterium]|nr:MAG: preprotein translocase subunit SecA [Dehalococcoidia bacterium]
MFSWFAGDSNERELKKLAPTVKRINELDPEFHKLNDEELKGKTAEFMKRLVDAVAGKKQEIDDVKKELAEAQSCLNTVDEIDRKAEISVQCKRLQDETRELDKDLRKEENAFLDELLPEAFAAVREAARRTIHQRHFDVQLMGGIVLHHGRIAEMRTGEGKTLVATLPLYLNALTGRGVHLVTVNDYLARRDPYWMGPVFHALGLSVASIYPMQSEAEHLPSRLFDPAYDSGKDTDPWRHFKPIPRKDAYLADITYGTSAEFGFDYLRDNMAVDLSQTVQREQNYAIVDEADNLLIDEARTPLIISGPGETPTDEYRKISQLVSKLKGREIDPSERRNMYSEDSEAKNVGYDYEYDEKNQSIVLTQEGQEKLAIWLHDPLLFEDETLRNKISEIQPQGERKTTQEPIEEPLERTHKKQRVQNALRAKQFYHIDHQYMVKEGKVLIVDEFTGRVLVGRRYSEGLHQAIEAKENVKVEAENRTYATVTIQNYFRMYAKLAGMTGTAVTEAEEFSKIYKLEVVVIPTNKPQAREDASDQIFKNEESKFKALVREVEEMHKLGRPVLIGTVAIENSEILSEMLNRRGIKHNVLNAKKHEQEAQFIAEAGNPGAVTVATNMAGRGVDIILGGKPPEGGDEKAKAEWQARHDKVVALGGLHVLGSERHEARRIDNQLRGRAGRQGDPGSSRFYVGLDDELMRRFGGERIQGIMNWAGMDENTPIENRLISRSIENAQTKVEGFNFDIRKHLVDYDDVINKQREIIYGERHKILSGADLRSNILDMVKAVIEVEVDRFVKVPGGEEPDFAALRTAINNIFPVPPEITPEALAQMQTEEAVDQFVQTAEELYAKKEGEVGPANMRTLERLVMLRVIDTLWVEHLTATDNMRQGVGLESMRGLDPIVAYKQRASIMFEELRDAIRDDVTHLIYRVSISKPGAPGQAAPPPSSPMTKIVGKPGENKPSLKPGQKPGRNEPCPCGSGKKYKHCCGK